MKLSDLSDNDRGIIFKVRGRGAFRKRILEMGFGCNVPAIMSTRMIENKNNRLLTMLINPFMSCSARLPVYILLIGAFFPGHRGTILFLIYLSGIFLAICVALILKRVFFRSKEAPFVMELPPYRMPTLRSIIKHMWYKASQYIKKIGGVILIASVIVWILGYFPRNIKYSADYDKKIEELNTHTITWTITDHAGNENTCSFDVIVNSSVEVETLQQKGISIYPNPTHGIVNFKLGNIYVQKLVISDISGKRIIDKTQIKQNETIDLSGFEDGFYIISIQTDKDIFLITIVKEQI